MRKYKINELMSSIKQFQKEYKYSNHNSFDECISLLQYQIDKLDDSWDKLEKGVVELIETFNLNLKEKELYVEIKSYNGDFNEITLMLKPIDESIHYSCHLISIEENGNMQVDDVVEFLKNDNTQYTIDTVYKYIIK